MSVQEWEEKAQILVDEAGEDCTLDDYIERLEAIASIVDMSLDAAREEAESQ